jgi:hypothetical protein
VMRVRHQATAGHDAIFSTEHAAVYDCRIY